jgi:hypothetical protein
MDSSIELPDELWTYIKEFIFYTKKQYEKVLKGRVTLQKIKLAYAVDIYDNYIFKMNGIGHFLECKEVYSVDDMYKVHMNKVMLLAIRLKKLIKQKSSLNNLLKIKEFTKFIIKEFKREDTNKVGDINIQYIKSEREKLRIEIQDLFMKYSLYFN